MFSWHISLLSCITLDSKPTARQTQYAHRNFTNCALADASVRCYISIFIGFKFFDGMNSVILILALCFVDPAGPHYGIRLVD